MTYRPMSQFLRMLVIPEIDKRVATGEKVGGFAKPSGFDA